MTSGRLLALVLALDAAAVGAAVALGLAADDLTEHFGEGRFISILSGLFLLATAVVAFRVFAIRRRTAGAFTWRASYLLWAVVAAGFVYLAADELMEIHEALDAAVHRWLQLEETALSDRIDDLIVALYGIAGIAVLVAYRRELTRLRPGMGYLTLAFVLLFLMVGVDTLTNRDDALRAMTGRESVTVLKDTLGVAEETFKLVAEGLFLAAFHVALRRARAAAPT